MKSIELKGGLILGVVCMSWLYLSFLMGLHESGIVWIQVVVMVNFFITLVGFIMILRRVTRSEPETNFLEGVRSGVIVAGISAVMAVLTQVVYFKWINPGWTAYMIAESRRHYSNLGLEAEQVETMAENAEKTFGLLSYAIQAGLGALFTGTVFSLIIMGIIRWRGRQ